MIRFIKNKFYIKSKNNIIFPVPNNNTFDKKNFLSNNKLKKITWKDDVVHNGCLIYKYKKYKLIDCINCGFIHAIPIPSNIEINNFYLKKYYNQKRKFNYFKHQLKNLNWWNKIFEKRLSILKKILRKKGSIIDIGCGPGFFLKYAKTKKWKVFGIEPSLKAYNYAKNSLGKNVINSDLDNLVKFNHMKFDVVYSHGVLEHLRKPKDFANSAKKLLKNKGIMFISVANDFNLFQYSMTFNNRKRPWWIIPPEHINYFNFESIITLFKKNGFDVLDVQSSFPIDIFLLMGLDYTNNKKLGKKCQEFRMNFEKNLSNSYLENLNEKIYKHFANLNLGRQIDIILEKK